MINSEDLEKMANARNEPEDLLTEKEKIAIMQVFFKEYDRLKQAGENAPYACFMAERARLIAYNETRSQKAA